MVVEIRLLKCYNITIIKNAILTNNLHFLTITKTKNCLNFAMKGESKMTMIADEVNKIEDKLIEIREHFHKYPELSFQEVETSKKIAEILQELKLDEVHTGIAKTGVIGVLRGNESGKTLAIRADIDALPIQEENDVPYKSQNNGVMHACGHDAHITTSIGTAMILSKMRDKIKGNIKFIFQPAEEIGGGAKLMVDEGVMENVDAIVGLHVWTGLDVGTIGIKAGPDMASAYRFEISVKALGGHGAMPHLTADPIVASAQIINALQTIASRSIDPLKPIVLSICKIEGGSAFNIIPSEVRMEGTLRTLEDEVSTKALDKINQILNGVAQTMGVECKFNCDDLFPALSNDPSVVELIKKAGVAVLGSDKVLDAEPSMGSEDFSFFAKKVPGAMLRLGVADKEKGITSPVHRATFDINPKALSIGVTVMSQVALMYLG